MRECLSILVSILVCLLATFFVSIRIVTLIKMTAKLDLRPYKIIFSFFALEFYVLRRTRSK